MLYGCIYLEILDLRDSPVVKVPDYRKHLILNTRRLVSLDGVDIRPQERQFLANLEVQKEKRRRGSIPQQNPGVASAGAGNGDRSSGSGSASGGAGRARHPIAQGPRSSGGSGTAVRRGGGFRGGGRSHPVSSQSSGRESSLSIEAKRL